MMTSLIEGYSSVALFVVVIIVAMYLGHRLGNKLRDQHADVTKGTGTVDGGVLGLLGLILTFVLLNAENRFEDSIDIALAQANALGTVYDQSKVLPEPARTEIQSLLKRYATAQRTTFTRHDTRSYKNPEYLEATDVYWRLWNRYVLACKTFSAEICASTLLPNISRIQEVHLHQVVERQTHSPRAIMLFVIILSVCGAGLCGFSLAAHSSKRMRLHRVMYLIAMIATYFTIIDLEYPRSDLIHSKQLVTSAFDNVYKRMGLPR